jgi:hypothetical protein
MTKPTTSALVRRGYALDEARRLARLDDDCPSNDLSKIAGLDDESNVDDMIISVSVITARGGLVSI